MTYMTKWKKNFFTLFAGQVLSIIGSNVVQFAVTLYLAMTADSPIILTLAMLAGYLPQVILGPVIGVLVDRSNRKTVMVAADLFVAATSAGLMLLFLTSQPPFWVIFLALMLRSVGQGFHEPAFLAVIPMIVPKQNLTAVNGLKQAIDSVALIAAPVIAAFMLSLFPIAYVMIADIGGAVVASMILLFFVPVPKSISAKRRDNTRRKSMLSGLYADLKVGVRALSKYRGLILLALVVTCAAFIFVPITTLFVLLITNGYGGGSAEVAIVQTAFGVGMLLGSFALGLFGKVRRKVLGMAVSCTGMGGILLCAALLPPDMFYLLVLLASLGGMLFPILTSPFFAMVQTLIDSEVLGRVMALIKSVTLLATPVGLLLAGPVSQLFGVASWFLVAGAVLAALGIMCMVLPSIRRIDAVLQHVSRDAKQLSP